MSDYEVLRNALYELGITDKDTIETITDAIKEEGEHDV